MSIATWSAGGKDDSPESTCRTIGSWARIEPRCTTRTAASSPLDGSADVDASWVSDDDYLEDLGHQPRHLQSHSSRAARRSALPRPALVGARKGAGFPDPRRYPGGGGSTLRAPAPDPRRDRLFRAQSASEFRRARGARPIRPGCQRHRHAHRSASERALPDTQRLGLSRAPGDRAIHAVRPVGHRDRGRRLALAADPDRERGRRTVLRPRSPPREPLDDPDPRAEGVLPGGAFRRPDRSAHLRHRAQQLRLRADVSRRPIQRCGPRRRCASGDHRAHQSPSRPERRGARTREHRTNPFLPRSQGQPPGAHPRNGSQL